MPYQSFPGHPGDSDSDAKLTAIRLPDLSGKSVLDIGCNEGFFCFEAVARGARQVIGIDNSEAFIAEAKRRAEAAGISTDVLTFERRDWNDLPAQQFDVIICLSALHYADDQPALIHILCSHLSADGVFVLECGVIHRVEAEFVEVERGIDRRIFPTLGMMREILEPYAWKLLGSSVAQRGDPTERKVFHIRLLKPIVLIVEGRPYEGKTTLARMFEAEGISTILMDSYVQWRPFAPPVDPRLAAALTDNFHIEQMYRLYERLSRSEAGELLIADLVGHLKTIEGRLVVVEGAIWSYGRLADRFVEELIRAGFYPWRTRRAIPTPEATRTPATDKKVTWPKKIRGLMRTSKKWRRSPNRS